MKKTDSNPFLNRAMIRDPSHFFGREREILYIFNRLNSSRPQSIAVTGMRRIGKSSLLYHITHNHIRRKFLDSPGKYLFTYLDLQSMRGADASKFFHQLAENARDEKKDLNIPDIQTQQEFLELVQYLNNEDIRWVIILDEFEILTSNNNFGADFFSFLRSAANNHNLSYITATGIHLEKLCHTKEIADSPFFNIFSSIRLTAFPPETAQRLITDLSKRAGCGIEAYSPKIVEFVGLLPMFLQMGCAATVDNLLYTGNREVPDWEGVKELFLGEALSHYNYLWRNYNKQEKYLLAQLSQNKKINNKVFGHILRSLIRDGLIEEGKARPAVSSIWLNDFLEEISDNELHQYKSEKSFKERFMAFFGGKRETDISDKGKSNIDKSPVIEPELRKYAGSNEPSGDRHGKKLSIMYADIKNSSDYFKKHGDLEGISMIQQHNELLFPVIEEKKGNIFKIIGDALMVRFQEPLESLKAAVDMQKLLAEFNQSMPLEKQIHIRIVLNFGEGIIKGGDVSGEVVNTASEMESFAEGDQIIISEAFFSEIKDMPGIKQVSLKERELKGEKAETKTYEVLWR